VQEVVDEGNAHGDRKEAKCLLKRSWSIL
jgi:hypothetical protein